MNSGQKLLSPFYRWRNWDTECSSDCPKLCSQEEERDGTQSQLLWIRSPGSFFFACALREPRTAESLEEASLDKRRIDSKKKMHLVGMWAYLEIVKVVKPEKARSNILCKCCKGLGQDNCYHFTSCFSLLCQISTLECIIFIFRKDELRNEKWELYLYQELDKGEGVKVISIRAKDVSILTFLELKPRTSY